MSLKYVRGCTPTSPQPVSPCVVRALGLWYRHCYLTPTERARNLEVANRSWCLPGAFYMQDSAFGALAAHRQVGSQRQVTAPHHGTIHSHIFGKGTVGESGRLVSIVIEAAFECSRSQACSGSISDAGAL